MIDLAGIPADRPATDPFDPASYLRLLERSESECWIHSGWTHLRRRIGESLARTAQPVARLERFCTCGANAWVMVENATGKAALRASYCHDRFCQVCSAAKARQYADRTAAAFADAPRPLFITLTLSRDCGRGQLAAAVSRLQKGFADLRRLALWKDRVRGGVAFLEIKWSDKAGRWHPHLHVMADAKYIDQRALSDAWRAVTGDSFIVDVRRVSGLGQAVGYVAKYASKPLNSSFSTSPDLLDEAVLALKGRRLVIPFGVYYHSFSDLESDNERSFDETWTCVGTFAALSILAASGDVDAQRIYAALTRRWTRPTSDREAAPPG